MILFLDFDGVLHPIGSTPDQYFSCLPLLEKFLKTEAPFWKVVISSSWREHYSHKQLLEFFSSDLQNRIIGSTVLDSDRALHSTWGAQTNLYPREIQIRHFLAQRGFNKDEWIALDDIAEWFCNAETNNNLILCNPEIGLSENNIYLLRLKLKSHL